jgi:hypothetical protein
VTQPFRVDPTQLTPIADDVDRLGHALTGMERGLQPHAGGGDAVFAEYGAARAWAELVNVWRDEVQIASFAAHEWSASVRRAIDNYLDSDGDSAHRLAPR